MSKKILNMLIKNGLVVSANGQTRSDVWIKDGKVAAVDDWGKIQVPEDVEIYDAAGKWVLPGLVEPHMHIAAPLGGVIDIFNFESVSECAAYGGVTSFMDFSSTLPGMEIRKAVSARLDEMKVAKQDHSVHAKVVSLASPRTLADQMSANARVFELGQELEACEAGSKKEELKKELAIAKEAALCADAKVQAEIDAHLDEIPKLIREDKIPTFKLFMTYRKANVMIDDTDMLRVMKKITECGGMVGFHAESNPISEYYDEYFGKEGLLDAASFPESKSNICESEAVGRVLTFAEMLGARIYFFHISTKESLDLIRKAKKRGVKVTAETCCHYLTLTKEKYKGTGEKDGRLYMMSPPLRTKEDVDALWEAINDGTISLVTSDNCTFTVAQKTSSDDYRKVISGVSGIGERLGLLLGEGVKKERISLSKFVEITSENPARVFGCYPKKGALVPGLSDADIVIVDPTVSKPLTASNLHYPKELDYSVYGEFISGGWPEMVIRRVEVMVKNGSYDPEISAGEVIQRVL